MVFTLPAPIATIAYQNKALIYGLLFDVAAETLLTIGSDPKHLGARIGVTLVLHTWGSALTHHPHVHGIVPGGGLSPDSERSIGCRPGFFLSVRVLSRLFRRRRFLEELAHVHRTGRLQFFGEHAALADAGTFARWLAPLDSANGSSMPSAVCWPRGGARLSVALHPPRGHLQQPVGRHGRARRGLPLEGLSGRGRTRHKTMTLAAEEFVRRFLLHVLPGGFHRIRHYGLLANGARTAVWRCARARDDAPARRHADTRRSPRLRGLCFVRRHFGAPMLIVETSVRGQTIRAPPPPHAS